MAAFAIFTEGHSGKICLLRVNRNDFNAGFVKEQVEFASHGFGRAVLEDDPSFDRGRCRDQLSFRSEDEIHEPLAFGFTQKNGDESGGVDDHRDGRLTRDAVLVVSEDFVLGQVILARQRVHAAQYLK